MQYRPGSMLDAAKQVLSEATYATDVPNKGIMYDGKGVKVGKTYQMKQKIGSGVHSIDIDVTVIKIDRNIVIFRQTEKPGTMRYQPERMPIEDFEDKLLTS